MATIPGMKTTFKSNVGDFDATAQDDLGCILYGENAAYKYVKFSGTTAITIGDVMCYVASDTSNQTVDGANTAFGAGVATFTNATTGTPFYGWIQIRGVATLSTALAGSPAVGDNMTTSGAAAPAVTKSTASNMQIVGNVVNVAGKIIALQCDN